MQDDELTELFVQARRLEGKEREIFLGRLPADQSREIRSLLDHDLSDDNPAPIAKALREQIVSDESPFELFARIRKLDENERRRFLEQLPEAIQQELQSLLDHDEPEDQTPAMAKRMRDIVGQPISAEPNSSCDIEPPSTRYPIKGTIGRGGMGIVLRAQDDRLRRDVAMKLLLPDGSKSDTPTNETRVRRFVEEAQITGQLDHPGVVPVYELGDDDKGQAYFTMRLVKGMTLSDVFDRVKEGDPEWTQARALSTLLRVCETMAFAHSRDIVHRDLKPSNIMVGKFGEAYVMDWGIAKVLGQEDKCDIRIDVGEPSSRSSDEDGTPLRTQDGDVVGTPAYMAPEQARGEIENVAQPADVYAMGAILYQLLSGERPYQSRGPRLGPRMVHAQVLSGPPDPIASLAHEVSPELVAICDKAMARDVEQRYPDMGAMSDDLRAYLENRVVKAHRTGAWIELRKWVQRNKGMAAALMSTLVVTGLGVTAYLVVTIQSKKALAESKKRVDIANAELRESEEALRAQKEAAEDSLRLLSGMLESANPHGASGPNYSVREMLDDFEQNGRLDQFNSHPEVAVKVRLTIGRTYRGLAYFDRAEKQLTVALNVARDTFGPEDLRTLEVLESLSLLRKDRGELKAAEEGIRRVLRERRLRVPEQDASVATALSNLGLVLFDQGRLKESEESLRKALSLRSQVLPPNSPYLGESLSNLGTVLLAQGRYDDAEDMYRQAFKNIEESRGQNHPDAAEALSNLASVQEVQGRFQDAEALLRQALRVREHAFGKEHPAIAATLGDLGYIAHAQGRTSEAADLTQKGLEMSRTFFGEDHPIVGSKLVNLGRIFQSQGLLAKAEGAYEEALRIYRSHFGDDHPYVGTALNNLAYSVRTQGRNAEAIPLYLEALDIDRKQLGNDHPDIAMSLSNLAMALRAQGDLEQAERYGRECLEMSQRVLRADHPQVAIAHNNLSFTLRFQGKLEEAETSAREALKIEAAAQGQNLPEYVKSLLELLPAQTRPIERAKALIDFNSGEGAEPLLQRALEGDVKVSEQLRATIYLGRFHLQAEAFDQAEEFLNDAYFEWDEAGIDDNELKEVLLSGLVEVCTRLERSDEAEEWQDELENLKQDSSG